MNFLCKMGKHKWRGCKCENCGTVRDTDHQFFYIAGNPSSKHPCCKCQICGKVHDYDHNWIGCKCQDCGKIRDEQHNYKNGICTRCRTKIPVDLPSMSEEDRALLVFDPRYSMSTRMEALDSVPLDRAVKAYQSVESTADEVVSAFLDRLSQDALKDLVASGYGTAALKIEDIRFFVDECIKANTVHDYIRKLDTDKKQAVLEALLENPDMRVKACLAMGGHLRDKNCKCTRCGVIAHDWIQLHAYRNTEVETYQCRYCGAKEYYQVNT